MGAIFRINQDSVTGDWGIARADLQLVGAGGSVTLEAQDTMSTYLWELISIPDGSTATITNSTLQIATWDPDVTGGYLVRLTVDAGLPTEDLLVLYLGVILAYSGMSIPAFNETSFDNRDAGYEGYERKLTAWFKWADTAIGDVVTGDKKVQVSAADTTADFLLAKLFAGTGITLSTVNPGGNEQVRLDSSGGMESPLNTVTIDIENGSDVTGDGKPGTPYQTLPYAITQVGQPVNGAAYVEPQTFVLKKGTYSANVVIPTYQSVTLILEEALLTGDIDWHLDPTYLYGLDPSLYRPTLSILGYGLVSEVTDIEVTNVDPATGELAHKTLYIQDVLLKGNIINEETGHAAVASGPLTLITDNVVSAAVSTKRIGGRYESVIGIATAPNVIYLKARNCDFLKYTICGCTQLVWTYNTQFLNADYRMDPSTGSTGYTGIVEGETNTASEGMVGSQWNFSTASWFGSATVTPNILTGDAYTMNWFLQAAGYTFTGFAVDSDQPYDWWRVRDSAEGVRVDKSQFVKQLNGLRTTQECFEKIDLILAMYSQDAEPTLAVDGDTAMWVDTNDSNRVWLVFRRGSGDQVKVELT